MKVSLNTVKKYTDIDLSVDELVEKINTQLGAIEEIIDLGAKYKDAVIVKVVEAEQHPNADRLRVTKIDDGGVVADVPRDENGYVQVVCGAPNARAGITAVWLPPRATVPASFDDAEPFVLSARELRGVLSQGMLSAADELAIGTDHEGIIEIHEHDVPKGVAFSELTGKRFADVFGLNDTVVEIENKMFTHRPDLFGQIGVAREIAGIQHKQFTSPQWYLNQPVFGTADGLELEVFNEAPETVPRFIAVAVKDVEIKPSPLWLQAELVRLGGKPINNIVDATNYIMLLTAQPVHAYDYDKLRGQKLGARMARTDETVKLLNGKTYTLDESDIVIVDGEGPVGLAGIMGGGESEVSSDTKNIVLEVATFDMYTLRKSSMRHGVFTDALTRFNKGQSPLQNAVVLAKLLELVGGTQASAVFDEGLHQEASDPVVASVRFINERLGLQLSLEEIQELLTNVELRASDEDGSSNPSAGDDYPYVIVSPAFWRTDLELPEDIVEEVGRLYGFEKLPRELPTRSTKPTPQNDNRRQARTIRNALARAGANEVLSYSFVHKNIIERAGQNAEHAYQISNALSPDLQFYRLSVTPSLLDKVHANVRAGFGRLSIFEIGKTHLKGRQDVNEPDLPREDRTIALTVAYSDKQKGADSPYYVARKYLEQITVVSAENLVVLSDFEVSADEWVEQMVAPFEPKRSAVIVQDGRVSGVVGEYRESVKRAFKLPSYSAGFEILQARIVATKRDYRPLSKYPSVVRDVCFEVSSSVAYGALLASIAPALSSIPVAVDTTPIDIFQQSDEKKRITLRIELTSHDGTLTGENATDYVSTITDAAESVGATVV